MILRPDEALEEKELRQIMQVVICKLRPKYRKVIWKFYIEGKTLVAIGKEFKVTSVRIAQIRDRSLVRMKQYIKAHCI